MNSGSAIDYDRLFDRVIADAVARKATTVVFQPRYADREMFYGELLFLTESHIGRVYVHALNDQIALTAAMRFPREQLEKQ